MITTEQLKQAAKLIFENLGGSVPMLQRMLSVDFETADQILSGLIELGVIKEEDIYRSIDLSEESQQTLELFLSAKNSVD